MAEKILIVDDDLETLRLVGLMLQRQGYQIISANTGGQALHMAAVEHPDAILLDVMMPDMDGYEVTRMLRRQPETAGTPIMMFTAKSMVDDKVAGYEAGVDDYITKPIHPAELVAHIKALLTRNRNRVVPTVERGYTIGFIGARGGLGVSSLVLNLAITLQRKNTKAQVIAAELRSGHGTWGVDLGYAKADGLNNLLNLKPDQLNLAAVEKELVQSSFGVRLLLASNRLKDAAMTNGHAQLDCLVQELTLLGTHILLDLGSMGAPGFDKVFNQCQEMVVVTESNPATVQRTRLLMDDLQAYGFGKVKVLTPVVYNRVRTEMTLPINQVQDMLNQQVSLVFPPTPETAYNASLRSVPIVNLQPEGATAMQFSLMADSILQRLKK